ncbi:MAG: DNA-directed RNA polymerase subunit omega [Rhodospirillales bacterium]|nr:DNA-directed RNA polymerase subunit omega [Rhodospirillales bacterium]
MARVTVEDCIPVVNNRFELVLYAAERSRAIARGSEITVQKDDDKDSVVALREIAEGNLDLEALQEGIVRSLQNHFERDEADEDPIEAYARSLGLDQVPVVPDADMLSSSEVEAASVPDAEQAGMHVADSAAELNSGDDEDTDMEGDLDDREEPDMALGLEAEPGDAGFDEAGED